MQSSVVTAARDQPHPDRRLASPRMQKPSCLISWSHSGPAGTLVDGTLPGALRRVSRFFSGLPLCRTGLL